MDEGMRKLTWMSKHGEVRLTFVSGGYLARFVMTDALYISRAGEDLARAVGNLYDAVHKYFNEVKA